jgi:hypothetical protein
MVGIYNIFNHHVAKNNKETWFHYGSGGQTYKSLSFYTSENDSQGSQYCKDYMKKIANLHVMPKEIV